MERWYYIRRDLSTRELLQGQIPYYVSENFKNITKNLKTLSKMFCLICHNQPHFRGKLINIIFVLEGKTVSIDLELVYKKLTPAFFLFFFNKFIVT